MFIICKQTFFIQSKIEQEFDVIFGKGGLNDEGFTYEVVTAGLILEMIFPYLLTFNKLVFVVIFYYR